MKKLAKLFLSILKDERGGIFGSLTKAPDWLGGERYTDMLGLGKGTTEVYDPYADLRKKWTDWTSSKLGTSTPYKYNTAFDIEQPAVEKAAESTILGKLNNPTSNVSDYSEATKKYSDAYKASQQEAFDTERTQAKDMYNRLGLVSSTPGLSALGDIDESQRVSSNLFDADLMYKNLDRTLTAQGLDINQLNSILGQAQTMGQTQRQSQQYGQQMSLQDIERMVNEEYGYGQQAASILGQTPPEQTYNPSWWEQLLGVASEVAPQVATAAIMSSSRRYKKNIKLWA